MIGAGSRGGYVGLNTVHVNVGYRGFPALSDGERTALGWLGQHTVPGERVMNDRADGSVWMYALEGLRPVEWTFYGAEPGTDAAYLSVFLNDLDRYPKVRRTADRARRPLRLRRVGHRDAEPAQLGRSRRSRPDAGFRQVFRNADAAVYGSRARSRRVPGRVTGSDAPASPPGSGARPRKDGLK